MRFKLLSGIHRQGGKTYSARDPQNCVVDSDQDLVALHGAERWRRLDGDASSYEELPADETLPPDETEAELEAEPTGEDSDLESMSVADLRQYAHSSGVDVSGLSRKADLIAAIRAAESA